MPLSICALFFPFSSLAVHPSQQPFWYFLPLCPLHSSLALTFSPFLSPPTHFPLLSVPFPLLTRICHSLFLPP
ncbi:hypothetical protein BKA80DRAFT_267953 [Phyllosticta citrichinensis]